jgi:hypothetical protein
MASPDESRYRGADEPQTFVHPASILSEHAISPNDVFTDPLSRPSFIVNALKAKALKACQKNDFITIIICFFEALIFLEQ